ncbi:MAG: DEAD/DEAH box helicase, partial [Candidatus Hydrogenedentota bacterium]
GIRGVDQPALPALGVLEAQGHDPRALSSIIDYFPENTIFAVDEPLAIMEEAERLEAQFASTSFMMTWDEATSHARGLFHLSLAQIAHDPREGALRMTAPMLSMSSWRDRQDGFWDQLTEWDQAGYAVQLYCNNPGERRRLLEILEERGYRPGKDAFDLRIGIGQLRAGFASPKDKFAVLSEREIFGRKYVRRKRRRFSAGAAITAFSDLKAGDYIVHMDHGVGRYLGLRRFQDRAGDFLGVQYAGGDIMYLPVTHVDLVQKYVGGDGVVPKIDRLGGASWAKTKGRVKKAVKEMTEELLRLYAARETQEGQAFSPDTHWQREFEDAFEYDETPDQIRAILDVKADMQSPKPMERLICGDVGYGKTEVAMRAAFKAVMDGFQVAVLVPTTILAEQHYNTFRERLADFPVKVEMLSRFRSPKQQGEIVRKLRDGELDIVIGTHRLTSGDVKFHNLGLIVLDEEQRFGVKHKERLKHLKTNVDVLSLSATPIPRTMHMALMGVRDMSVINTAPNDRLPIHTCIEVFDEQLIAEAIARELAREGQVFYLHNRVQTIASVATVVKKLVPRARVGIGHGQMHEDELEEVMARFIRGELDVLVCT